MELRSEIAFFMLERNTIIQMNIAEEYVRGCSLYLRSARRATRIFGRYSPGAELQRDICMLLRLEHDLVQRACHSSVINCAFASFTCRCLVGASIKGFEDCIK